MKTRTANKEQWTKISGGKVSGSQKEMDSLNQNETAGIRQLPQPATTGTMPVENALAARRSIRRYSRDFLQTRELGQLAWAAQGITSTDGKRTAPSAGALYPLEIYVAVNRIVGLDAGVYHYRPETHDLVPVVRGHRRRLLSAAALLQPSVYRSAVVIIIAADFGRTTTRYGNRGIRYVYTEAGHVAQNIYLQALPLNLGTVVIGAFHTGMVKKVLHLPGKLVPVLLMPVGRLGEG